MLRSGHASLLPRPSQRAWRPDRDDSNESRHSLPGTAAGDQLADDCGVPVLREASHSPAIAKIISNFGSPFGSLTIISFDHGMRLAC